MGKRTEKVGGRISFMTSAEREELIRVLLMEGIKIDNHAKLIFLPLDHTIDVMQSRTDVLAQGPLMQEYYADKYLPLRKAILEKLRAECPKT